MKVEKCLSCGSTDLHHITERLDGVGVLECRDCLLMMVDKIAESTEDLYTKSYFEKKQNTGHGYNDYLSKPNADIIGKYAFSALLGNGTGKHLDIGCADGSLMEIFKQEGYSTSGLEISEDAVAIARGKGLDVKVSNLHDFPSSVKQLDNITAFDVIEHLDKPRTVLENVKHSLNEKGVFVFSTLNVKKKESSDYWFNNSLEHYVYYNKKNITKLLTEVFGKNNFKIIEESINGINEIWGVASKDLSESTKQNIETIAKRGVPSNKDQAYLSSLVYNQLADTKSSNKVIESFKDSWEITQRCEAIFYHNYVLGQFSQALEGASKYISLVPSDRGVFWKAHSYAREVLSNMQINDAQKERDSLSRRLFVLEDELRGIYSSRVIGKTIALRKFARSDAPVFIKGLPRRSIGYTKNAVGFFIPYDTKKYIGAKKRGVISSVKKKVGLSRKFDIFSGSRREIKYVPNEQYKQDYILSVVIPYYNREATIDDTLKSLTQQTFSNFETILVDDGSTEDASKAKLKEIKSKYESLNLTIIKQKNQGVATARNNGIKKAIGKYIICLDSDDMLEPTYVEKCLMVLEPNPEISLVTTHRQDMGVFETINRQADYHPQSLEKDNMVTTASAFTKDAFNHTPGYRPNIGYEDWDLWLSMSENGDWGYTISEPLFLYRVALESRYIEDKNLHRQNIKTIKNLHKGYVSNIKSEISKRKQQPLLRRTTDTALINIKDKNKYLQIKGDKPTILIAMSWMTFGGAETLVYNFCKSLKDRYNFIFVTGLSSKNEWEYKFSEISDKIYHLPHLFLDKDLFPVGISHIINVHQVDVLHIVHCGYVYEALPLIKENNPNIKTILTLFNDRVPDYVDNMKKYQSYLGIVTVDSEAVGKSLRKQLKKDKELQVIPNGIDVNEFFNPKLYERSKLRDELDIKPNEKAVFFVGRLSEEKNPDVFIKVAQKFAKSNDDVKFFIVGDGPMYKECDVLIHEYKLKNVRMLGYSADVAQYLAAADVMILSSSIEGFPLSILEAMSMEVAVVASSVGAIPDVIKHGQNGMCVSPGSVGEINTALSKLVNDENLLSSIKKAGRTDVKKLYSEEVLRKNYVKLYREVIK